MAKQKICRSIFHEDGYLNLVKEELAELQVLHDATQEHGPPWFRDWQRWTYRDKIQDRTSLVGNVRRHLGSCVLPVATVLDAQS